MYPYVPEPEPEQQWICEAAATCKFKISDTHCEPHYHLPGCKNSCHGYVCIPIPIEPKPAIKPSGIKIKYDKIIPASGIKSVKIKSITGVLTIDKLPVEYFKNDYFYWEIGDFPPFISMHKSIDTPLSLAVGKIMEYKDFQKAIQFMDACGDRLHEINQRLFTN